MSKHIALIELHQETNSFSQVPTTLREFESLALYYGEEVLTHGIKVYKKFQLAGFISTVKQHGQGRFKTVPILAAWATSGGPIEASVYKHFHHYILEQLQGMAQIDGIYLSLHGAMGVEGMRDPEAYLLRAIRQVVGEAVPIGVSYDLHGNITEEKVRLATFINAYQTNPHRDHFKVGQKAARLLMDTMDGKVNPTMAFLKMPLLKGGGMTIDFLKPMRKVFGVMRKMEKRSEVLSISNFMSHIWLDDEETGWSCIAVTDNNPQLARELSETLADLNWSIKDHKHPEPVTVQKAVSTIEGMNWRRRFGTAVFCDTSDIVAAGGPGENTYILKYLMQNAPHLKSYLPLRDQEEVLRIFEFDIGHEVTLTLGRKLEQEYNATLSYQGLLTKKSETKFGKTAVVRHANIFLVLTELPCPAFSPSFFKNLGLSLWKADIVVVKNLFPFRVKYSLYNRKTFNVGTSGTTELDVSRLNYKKIPRPIHPLDTIADWRKPIE
ncbi:MAG: M81 family metallopeptidase [Cyclobacteriaceae bacterium]|nr:M81 family metallopeptidase [Cyclobacteriaceae bacterium]